MSRRKSSRLTWGLVFALAVAAVFASAALAAKPSSYSPTLTVNWPTLSASSTSTNTSTNYVVKGCGFNSSYGGVTVVVQTPVAISFAGQIPDASGCISVANFWTQGAGHYQINAYQTLRNKDVIVASTGFDL